jgi:hypothetical protein
LPGKKKAAAQNDEQPTEDGGRRLIARKSITNHHHTDGQMNKWKTSEERCKPTDDVVKYREQLKVLFFLCSQGIKKSRGRLTHGLPRFMQILDIMPGSQLQENQTCGLELVRACPRNSGTEILTIEYDCITPQITQICESIFLAARPCGVL